MGRHCECGFDTPLGSGEVDDSSCKATNTSKICSGQGSCNCGECVCNERDNLDEVISGKYCDCTNFLCDRHDGELCSGPAHGTCVCDKCICRPGWTGDACQCMNSTQDCINPDTGVECSGNGKCECNQCKCFEAEGGRYSGKWCEDCPACPGKCKAYRACAQCQVFGTGEYNEEECAANCTLFNATKVDVAVEIVEKYLIKITEMCSSAMAFLTPHELLPTDRFLLQVRLDLLWAVTVGIELCGLEFQCSDFKECVECRVFEFGPLMEEPGACDR
ncbi:hypothetical protein HAZT_HAZT010530 [Hyalella azteca]|uniref:Uncharacterized protein n=1 Tax=Hyalella azteca TaxID=294128 RepID=A0A6A0H4H9_HYAAZ|nr:hypothetical protein HAZT_HAZT010530 [Hyalella azteca]